VRRTLRGDGLMRQAISVVTKRSVNHERTIREFRLEHNETTVSEPLSEAQGLLRGVIQHMTCR